MYALKVSLCGNGLVYIEQLYIIKTDKKEVSILDYSNILF